MYKQTKVSIVKLEYTTVAAQTVGCSEVNGPLHEDAHKLIGNVPKVNLLLGDVPVNCILDTGSNVLLMRNSFFLEHFAEKGEQLKEADSWLTLEAANGLDIPYLGYVLLPVKVGEVEVPEGGFLVVKDHCLTDTEGVVGMNIIRRCWRNMDNKPLHCLSGSQRQQQAWAMAFKICSTQAQFVAPDGSIGHVRTINRCPVRVPAQSDVLLWGRTKVGPGGKDSVPSGA